jgi:hypothetical protein
VRPLIRTIRKPAVWLLVLLFLAWGSLFYAWLPLPPAFETRTTAVYKDDIWARRPAGTWPSLRALSDDGDQATISIYKGDFRFGDCWLELWDTHTGANLTPELWRDAHREGLITEPAYWDRGMLDMLTHPAGKKFLRNEETWAALRRRLAAGRAGALDDLRKTIRPVQDSDLRDLFPRCWSISPDGLCFAYVARHTWPLYGSISEDLGDGTVVEDTRTGARRAFLPGLTERVYLAPGCRTAVSVKCPAKADTSLVLWDLDTSARRAELPLPGGDKRARVSYSLDGRYVFAHYWDWDDYRGGLMWWDVATGRQVGHVIHPGDTTFLDGGRVLVTHPGMAEGAAAREGYRMVFWDVGTGKALGEWDLGAPLDGGGMIDDLVASQSGRYLAAEYAPDYGRGFWDRCWFLDRLPGRRAWESSMDRHQVLLWDVVERRELARLPGSSAAFSADGRWLATLSHSGVVRVWEVPVRRPWARILGYAAACTLGCWLPVLLLARRSRS